MTSVAMGEYEIMKKQAPVRCECTGQVKAKPNQTISTCSGLVIWQFTALQAGEQAHPEQRGWGGVGAT